MAFLDKLKEKINKIVDVDKLSEMANKALKGEDAKTIDSAAKEQERLEKERAEKEREEQEKKEKEKAIGNFISSVEADDGMDYIFSVLEKSGASASNFEKGIEHLISRTETILTKTEVLPAVKKLLFTRAFADTESAIAKAVATDYFMGDIVSGALLSSYVRFAVAREGRSYIAAMEEPFIKALYGVAGRVVNYLSNRSEQGDYRTMTPDDFLPVIEDSDVLKSYTDGDPFVVDVMRKKWAEALCSSSYELVKSSRMNNLLEKEEYVDAMYFYAYTQLCQDEENPIENVCVAKVANVYITYLKEYYNRIKH